MRTHVVPVFVVSVLVACGDGLHPRLVDTDPPDTMISAGPRALTATALASFTFAAIPDDDGAAFECAVDAEGFLPCTSPFTVTRPDGAHTFRVRAADASGNIDPTPATRAWSIDTIAPVIALAPPAIPARTSNPLPVAFFTVTDASRVTTTCSVDAADPIACDGTAGFTPTASLSEGPHTYRVTASDEAGNATFVDVAFAVDVTPPSVAISTGPVSPSDDDTPTFAFTTSEDTVRARCALDTGQTIDPCTSDATFAAVAPGAHTFTVTAFDDAEPANTASATFPFVVSGCGDNTAQGTESCDGPDLRGQSCTGLGFDSGTLACTASCTLDTSGCGTCGDGTVNGSETCDGADLDGATCQSLGHAPGTLACAPTCSAFNATGCDGGFTPKNQGFSGSVCLDGLKFGPAFVAACTEDAGVWRLVFQDGIPEVWIDMNGTTAGQQVTNLHGRAVIVPLDNPAVTFFVDNSGGANSYRSNLFSSTVQPIAWPTNGQTTFATAGAPFDMFAAKSGSSVNNVLAGWHPTLGAVVLHGNANNNATISPVGPTVTGTVTSIATGAFSLPSTDILIAVFGQTPSGEPALGGGIYWTCDQNGTMGGTYVRRDTGIPDDDKPLVATLLPDLASFSPATRTCPTTGGTVGGFATTHYAALRGGGQLYKTADGGEHWTRSNTGLPAGAEVFSLAADCQRVVSGFPNLCNNHQLLYAATSLGLYTSTDAAATWTLAGLEGKSVRAVTITTDHPVGTNPRVIAGVDDDVKIYQKAP